MSRPTQEYGSSYAIGHVTPASPRLVRQVKTYLTHVAINNPTEAKILSRRIAWDVLSHVKASGPNGISAGELSSSLDTPLSEVYSVLRELSRLELVFNPPRAKFRRERRRRYASDRFRWGRYSLDRTLSQVLQNDGILREVADLLEEPFLTALVRTIGQLERTEIGSQLPSADMSCLCLRCGVNHEALDLFHAIALAILETLMDGVEFNTILSRLGYTGLNKSD